MTQESKQAMELAAYIGLDWSDEKHAICLQAAGSGPLERYEIEQQPEALHEWVQQLLARFGGRPVGIALEQSRGAVIYALMRYEFLVLYPINPKAVARYREAFACSGAKDDPTDAELLWSLLKVHRDKLRAWRPDDEATRTLALLVEYRRKIVDDRTRLTNRLTERLKDYFPQALSWAGDLTTLQACDFLLRWPTLTAVQQASPSEVRTFYREHSCRRAELVEQRIAQIDTARPLTQDVAVMTAASLMVQTLAAQIRSLTLAVGRWDAEVKARYEPHPDYAIFNSLPGAGPAYGPRLLVAMGSDRTRWASALEVAQFSGIAPVTERSGKSMWVHRRWACPTFIKQTFHEFAETSLSRSVWARAYYDQQRQRGKGHHAAVRALAYKWIRIIYRCWQTRTPYDEPTYLQALARKRSPLAALVCAA